MAYDLEQRRGFLQPMPMRAINALPTPDPMAYDTLMSIFLIARS
jgi:hypothetical protein